MALPKVVYNAGAGDITLQMYEGPGTIRCAATPIVHDNVATSGLRERVYEREELFLDLTMGALRVGAAAGKDDFEAWAAFAMWAGVGGEFQFYPQGNGATYYTCTDAGDGWKPERVGVGVYSIGFRWRIVPDAHAPANAGVVMEAVYGV